MKESEKLDKYLDLGWQPKNPWNMKATVISIIVGGLEIVLKASKWDCEEPIQLSMEFINLQSSEDFKSKFLACLINKLWLRI